MHKLNRWQLEEDKSRIPSQVTSEIQRIDGETLDRQQEMLEAGALYGNLGAWPGSAGVSRILPSSRRIAHNVIAPATDALVAEVTQSVPRPMAVTIGGNYQDRRRAKELTQYWDAKFDECDVHVTGRQAVRDAVIHGLGILRVYRENPEMPKKDRVSVERIFPPNFLIDDQNCVDVEPRQAYIRRYVDRQMLIRLFAEDDEDLAHKIETAPEISTPFWDTGHGNNDNYVEVYEGWSLASYRGCDDGRYVMVCGDALLRCEQYPRIHYPLAFCRAVPPQRGFWGPSLVKRAAPAQFELNKLLRRIQESMHLHAVPRVFLNRQSAIVHQHMQNNIGVMVEYDGEPPIFMTPSAMGRDVYNHIQRLEEWIYKEMGVSELSASSRKPPGLDSGAALRTYNDVQSRRFINLQRSYERMHEQVARELVHKEKEIAEDYADHSVGTKHRKDIRLTKWREIDLPDDRFHCRVFSASALPNTPAGKLQALEEMVKMEVIDTETFVRLADVPDFETVRNHVVAPEELIEDIFDSFLAGKPWQQPEPHMDLERARIMGALMIQRATLEGADQSDIEKIRRWITASEDMELRVQAEAMARQQAMMPPPPAPMEGPPMGGPPMPGPPGPPVQGPQPMMAGSDIQAANAAIPPNAFGEG